MLSLPSGRRDGVKTHQERGIVQRVVSSWVCVCVCMVGGAGVRRGAVETFLQNLVVAVLERAVLDDQLVEVLVRQVHVVVAAVPLQCFRKPWPSPPLAICLGPADRAVEA